MSGSEKKSVRLLVSHAPEDEEFFEALERHLAVMRRQGRVRVKGTRLRLGDKIDLETSDLVVQADVVVLLVSAYFTASDRCWEQLLAPAIDRARRGETVIVPVHVRATFTEGAPFEAYHALPRDGEAIGEADNEEAWSRVASELSRRIEGVRGAEREGLDSGEGEYRDEGDELWSQDPPEWRFQRGRRALVERLRDGSDGFAYRVEKLCRLREKRELVRCRGRSPFAGVWELTDATDPSVVEPVAALDGDPTEEAIRALDELLEERYRDEDPGIRARLIYRVARGGKAPDSLVRDARRKGIVLTPIAALQRLIDFTGYLERLRGRLANDAIYPQDLYIEQRGFHVAGRAGREVPSALDEVWSLVTDDRQPRFLIVLADFGTGKTFLLRQLAARLAEPKSDVVPILVELRALEKARSLNVLLAQHFTQAGENSYDLNAFYHMLEEGRIALLFDGFDELVPRVSFDRAAEHLETLMEAARGKAKVVITSRTQHFLTDKDVEMALARRAERVPHLQMFKLLPFSNDEIQSFLVRKLGSEEAAKRRFALLGEVTDLLGLSHNPRMLSFIAEIEEEKLLEAKGRTGHITKTELYTLLVQRWLGYEFHRAEYKGVPTLFDAPDRWRAVLVLAEKMWGTGDKGIELREIPEDLRDELIKLGPAEHDASVKVHHAASGTLLVRDEVGRFTFLHRSILEFAAAWAAARDLRAGRLDSRLLGATDMTDLMAEFLGDLATPEKAAAWAQQTLSGEGTAAAKKNAQRVVYKLSNAIRAKLLPTRVIRRNEVIRGENFAGADLRGADFSGSDLSEAVFTGANLTGANLVGSKLVWTDMRRALLINADLRGADMMCARMNGADLSGARLDNAVLRYACLLGAKGYPGPQGEVGGLDSTAGPDALGACPSQPSALSFVTLPGRNVCNSVAWSPDGALLAAGHVGGSIVIWSSSKGEPLAAWGAHQGSVTRVAFSPDGRWLASASSDQSVRLWRVADGALAGVLRPQSGRINSIAFSRDGCFLASGAHNGKVQLWRSPEGTPVRTIRGHSDRVTGVCFSPDGATLATSSWDRTVRIWRVSDGKQLVKLGGDSRSVNSVSFSPDGQFLAAASHDGTVRVWRTSNAAQVHVLGDSTDSTSVNDASFSSDGEHIVSISGRLARVWRADSGALVNVLVSRLGGVNSAAFHSDSRLLALASDHGSAQLWDALSGTQTLTLQSNSDALTSASFSPDGGTLAAASNDSSVRLWRVFDCTANLVLRGHSRAVTHVAFSPDGDSLATASWDGSVILWRAQDGSPRMTLRGHSRAPTCLAFDRRLRYLASSSWDGTIILWGVADGKLLRSFDSHPESIMHISFDSGGELLACALAGGGLQLLDTSDGTLLRSWVGHSDRVTSVVFSPNNKLLASASWDRSVRVWRASDGAEVCILEGHSESVSCVAFSPDGDLLASSSWDQTVRIWRVSDRTEQHVLEGHADSVSSVTFSPNGRLIASASDDGTIRLWRVSDGRCLAILHGTTTGWVAYTPDGRYKYSGDLQGTFWHVIGLCRFEPGELDEHFPGLRMKDDEPLFTL